MILHAQDTVDTQKAHTCFKQQKIKMEKQRAQMEEEN